MTEIEATKQIIKDAIERDIARDSENVAMYEELAGILAPFDGKKISKRLASAIEKAHPDWTVYYKDNYQYILYIWGGNSGRQWDDRWQFFTDCWKNGNRVFTLAGFEENSIAYYRAAIERNDKRQMLLNDDDRLTRLAQAHLDLTDAKARFESAMGNSLENPSKYSIERILGDK